MYTLYTIPGTCSTGITALLTKLSVDFKLVNRDDVEDYASLVPTNQVPALRDEETGKLLTEGAAIALYLLEKHAPESLPTDADDKAEFQRWLMFNYATLHPSFSKLFVVAMKSDMEEGPVKEGLLQFLGDLVAHNLEILDQRLRSQPYITGEKPTVVDYLAVIYVSWRNFFPQLNIPIGENIKRLVDDVSQLPEFLAAYETEGVAYSGY